MFKMYVYKTVFSLLVLFAVGSQAAEPIKALIITGGRVVGFGS